MAAETTAAAAWAAVEWEAGGTEAVEKGTGKAAFLRDLEAALTAQSDTLEALAEEGAPDGIFEALEATMCEVGARS